MDNENKWRLAYLKLSVKLEEERFITRDLMIRLAEKDLRDRRLDSNVQKEILINAKQSLTELERELGYNNAEEEGEATNTGTVLQVGNRDRKTEIS